MATRVLATAVYVAGTTRLEPGSRYSIAVRGSRLLLLGPTDVDPTTVILDRPVTQIDATAVEGRLVLSEPQNRSGPVMAFMSIAGPSTTELARMIHHAAGGAVEP